MLQVRNSTTAFPRERIGQGLQMWSLFSRKKSLLLFWRVNSEAEQSLFLQRKYFIREIVDSHQYGRVS